MSDNSSYVRQESLCVLCDSPITKSPLDGAWEDASGACGCGDGEHEPMADALREIRRSTRIGRMHDDVARGRGSNEWREALTNWENNEIQFPRLIAEIVATQDHLDIAALCESMDLEPNEVDELFDRALKRWDEIKRNYDQGG